VHNRFCFSACPQVLGVCFAPKSPWIGLASLNPIGEDFKKEVFKHVPAMRSLGLNAAADYLVAWVTGDIDLEPLLDVRAMLDCKSWLSFAYDLVVGSSKLRCLHFVSFSLQLRVALRQGCHDQSDAVAQDLEPVPAHLGLRGFNHVCEWIQVVD